MEQSDNIRVNENGNVVLSDGTELGMTADTYRYMQILRQYLMEILLTVDKFCKENNITYYLGEGTLLGAVRHGGFIPWDDDIDILLPREDYDRFLALAKDRFPSGYALDCFATNKKHYTIAKIEMTRKTPFVKKRQKGILLYNGPAIDLFPIDYVPDDTDPGIAKRGNTVRILRRTLWIKTGLHKRNWYTTLVRRLKYFYPLKIYGKFRTMKGIHRQIDRAMTETNNQEHNFGVVFGSLYYARRETFKNEYFGTPRLVNFEGHMLPIPSNAEKILERIYGDYTILPPVEDRKSKHFFDFDKKILKQMKGQPDYEVLCRVAELAKAEKKKEEKELKPQHNIVVQDAIEIGQLIMRVVRRVKRDIRTFVIEKSLKKPIKQKTVLYDAFSGLGILDSPRAIFKELISRDDFAGYTHCFAVNDKKLVKDNLKEYAALKNVKFINRGGFEYIRLLFTAEYVICNSSVPKYYCRRDGQRYLNTWHGVPLKVMGYERPGQRVNATDNIVHNFLNSTHLIAANEFTGERMFKKAYMLNGIYKGKLLNEPLPRTDTVRNVSREYAYGQLEKAGIKTDKKIVVYAPTWKGKLYDSLEYDLTELKNAVKTLRSNINTDVYEVFLRVHYFIYREVSMDEELSKICIPFTVDTDEMLAVTDILISDYSSIFFDFLGTGKPILFYVPDLAEYSENRGLYIPLDALPGPVSTTLEGVAQSVNNLSEVKAQYAEKYAKMREWCCHREDGNVVKRVVDSFFYDKDDAVISCKTDKKKIVFVADFMSPFIHQNVLTRLFDKIDYEKFDVTLITGNPKKNNNKYHLENINSNVRILVNDGDLFKSRRQRRRVTAQLNGETADVKGSAEQLDMAFQWRRITGDAEFDALFAVRPEKKQANWLLFCYAARVKKRYLANSEAILPNVFDNENATSIFDGIFDSTDPFEKIIKEM